MHNNNNKKFKKKTTSKVYLKSKRILRKFNLKYIRYYKNESNNNYLIE
jgi:hypothetical protein